MARDFKIVDGGLVAEGPDLDELLEQPDPDLAAVWRSARTREGLFTRELRVRDRTDLKNIGKALGKSKAAKTIAHSVAHWEALLSYTGTTGWAPREPNLRFLLGRLEAAVNLSEGAREPEAQPVAPEPGQLDLPRDRAMTDQEIAEQLALLEEDG